MSSMKGLSCCAGGHAVGHVGHALLLGVHILADFGEDVWVLRRGEDAVEVGLEEPLAGTEQIPRRLGGC